MSWFTGERALQWKAYRVLKKDPVDGLRYSGSLAGWSEDNDVFQVLTVHLIRKRIEGITTRTLIPPLRVFVLTIHYPPFFGVQDSSCVIYIQNFSSFTVIESVGSLNRGTLALEVNESDGASSSRVLDWTANHPTKPRRRKIKLLFGIARMLFQHRVIGSKKSCSSGNFRIIPPCCWWVSPAVWPADKPRALETQWP